MNLVQGENERELLEGESYAWNQVFSFIGSMSLKCAIQLGIPDIIHKHGKPMSPSELAAALPIHPSKASSVQRLMRVLVHSGFFKRQNVVDNNGEGHDMEEGYVLTAASRLALKDNLLGAAPLFLAALDPIMVEPWHHLDLWFQNSDTCAFATAHGSMAWEFLGREPRLNSLFNQGMACNSRMVAFLLIDKCKGRFEGLKSLVDVGGGTGTMTMALANTFPDITFTVLDLPHVVAQLEDTQNLKFVGGNMFEGVPPADAVMLKWILHNWNDEECVKILKQCKESIKDREGGKVMVLDMVMDTRSGDNIGDKHFGTQLFMDMQMMTLFDGRERDEKEWAKLFHDAGYNRYKISKVLGPMRSIIEIFP